MTRLRLTIEDLDEGTTEVQEVPDDSYWIVVTGSCDVAEVTAHANGTHVLTIRGYRDAKATATEEE
jgi:hypothetical protein